jgi:hypothetical protein
MMGTAVRNKARSRRGKVVAAVTAATMMVLFSACGGSGDGDKAASSAANGASVGNETDFTATPVQLTADPCTLVTLAEAKGVIGASVSQGLGADGRICTYTANGNGGIVAVDEVTPDFCKLLFTALEKNFFAGDQVRVDVGQGGMQVRGGGNVQFVVAGGCLTISASKGGTKVDDATVLAMAKTASGRVAAVVNTAALANADGTTAATSATQGGAVVTGVHASEEFCKTMIRQVELGAEFVKHQPLSPDMTTRAKYFADQKELNATLVKTAPASLASDAERFTRNANAMFDAQLAGDRARDQVAVGALTSPEHLAAAKRMSDYCGARQTTSN